MTKLYAIQRINRRRFLGRLPAVTAAFVAIGVGRLRAHPRSGDHPEPRPGIDASNVPTAEDLAEIAPDVIPVYDGIREMPRIADGLRCYCGCAELPGYRSLLTCYEGESSMAMSCEMCLGQAELAHRRWKEGQSLEQIRRAIDARFAPRGAR